MTDLLDISKNIEKQKLSMSEQNLSDNYDFDEIRKINFDDEGRIISQDIAKFLDWSESIFRSIPKDWKDYLPRVPSDLAIFFEDIEHNLDQICQITDDSLASRVAILSNQANFASPKKAKPIQSTNELLILQMIGTTRQSQTKPITRWVDDTRSEISRMLTEANANSKKLGEMVSASKESTAKIVASGKARIFHSEAKKFETAATIWLSATFLIGAILIAFSFGFAFDAINPVNADATTAQIASHIFGKLLCLSTLGAATAFSGRQYSTNKHNAVQNLHRSSALRTYRALLAASRDEAIHEAMLHQAALAIFSPSDTGYLKQPNGSENTPLFQLFQSAASDPHKTGSGAN